MVMVAVGAGVVTSDSGDAYWRAEKQKAAASGPPYFEELEALLMEIQHADVGPRAVGEDYARPCPGFVLLVETYWRSSDSMWR